MIGHCTTEFVMFKSVQIDWFSVKLLNHLKKKKTNNSGIWTQDSRIKTQHFITWATESDRLVGVLDGLYMRGLLYDERVRLEPTA